MAMFFGAIAYRTSLANELGKAIGSGEAAPEFEDRAKSWNVKCPRCGEVYALVEGADASDELFEDDKHFLAKGLGKVHPAHPAWVLIRDPQGTLHRQREQIVTTHGLKSQCSEVI